MLSAGMHAPAFEMKDLSGQQRSLTALLEQGPVVLAFFKVSCPVCQLTFPFLQRLSANNAVQIVGVSQDDSSASAAFNARFGVTFPTLLDTGRDGYPVSNAFGISSVPTLFLIETDGTISKAFHGFSKKDIEELGQRMNVLPFRPEENVPAWKAG
ncbi:MAG TPA: TlpA disulfide reductase family protein [Bryobacteraceae bacterium]|nr:TlpA disulfide reductase family protein [Bryobacteraceae bacterium]